MAGFTSAVIGAAAIIGGIRYSSTIRAAKQLKRQAERAAQEQAAMMEEYRKRARLAAKQQAATREDTGAKVKLGSDDLGNKSSYKKSSTGKSTRDGVVASSVGGLSNSKKLGL